MTFEELLAEGDSVPVEGWDFSWFDGRATEQRPSWGYAAMLTERVGLVSSVLDVQTGGGEVFDWVLRRAGGRPTVVAATESWPPNAAVARDRLASHGGVVVRASNFFDVAAVVVFLRKVPWTVPAFTTQKYRHQLSGLHHYIQEHGRFVARAQRYLIEARKPR
jgi:hypothetical protein